MPNRPVIKIIQNRDFLTSTREKRAGGGRPHEAVSRGGCVWLSMPIDGKLIGICTERDLAFKVLAEGLMPIRRRAW